MSTPVDTPVPIPSQMTNEDLLELYQQMVGRVSMYNQEAQIKWMFELRAEVKKRMEQDKSQDKSRIISLEPPK